MKLSIIIPCYNCEKTLAEAVASCYVQSFAIDEFEIVMVNDGSTDNTRTLMDKLASEHTNIRTFHHDKNQGGGATRNTAVEHAQADVIFCLDSDDMLPPNNLKRMYDYMLEKDCDAVCFHHSIKFNGNNVDDISHTDILPFAGEKIPFDSVFQTKGVCPVYLVFLMTKKAFTSAGGYPTHHGFDTQGFGWRFLASGLTAFTCPETSYLHRINNGDSYYIREYKQGKINYNWQKILFENLYIFDESVQEYIKSFDYSDFTRDLFEEIKKLNPLLKSNYRELQKERRVGFKSELPEIKTISRNSFRGILLRLKRKLLS